MSERICTNHQGKAPEEGGKWIVARTTRRWICAACLKKRNQALREMGKK